MSNNDPIGRKGVPAHYAGEREYIDIIRDSMSDEDFITFCRTMANRYAARAGKKERTDDIEKSRWYSQMSQHVIESVFYPDMGLVEDPRSERPGFRPYQRAKLPSRKSFYPFYPVLDHGFVRLVEHYGEGDARRNEAGIIEAARQSTQGSFRGWSQDEKLLNYLYENRHSTPFEFAGMILEVRAPIFVFREWHRHRTQSYNEMSSRYAPLPDLNYVPSLERLMQGAKLNANKQAGAIKDAAQLSKNAASRFQENLKAAYAEFELEYQGALKEGVPKELARLGMPVGRYSQMRVHANLRNWLAFMTLRCDPAAQWEIRQYADVVAKLIQTLFPRTFGAWAKTFQEAE